LPLAKLSELFTQVAPITGLGVIRVPTLSLH
jgi:hypothetical protein